VVSTAAGGGGCEAGDGPSQRHEGSGRACLRTSTTNPARSVSATRTRAGDCGSYLPGTGAELLKDAIVLGSACGGARSWGRVRGRLSNESTPRTNSSQHHAKEPAATNRCDTPGSMVAISSAGLP
jgi:hypothetical protein